MNPSKPVMAAALAAFSVMSSILAVAPARALVAPKTKPAQVQEETNPVNILAELIKKDKTAQADVSLRVQKLLLDPDFKGRSYVTADLPKDPLAKTIPAMVTKWVADHPGEAAGIYYVARPTDGKVPQWVLSHPKGATIFSDDEKAKVLPQRLGNYLAGTDQEHPAGSQIGTVAVSGMVDSVGKFLLEAAKGSQVILNPAVPDTSEAARGKVGQNDNTGVNVPTAPGSGGAINAPAAGFGFADLYKTGAVHQDVSGPNDGGPRTLSVKMYTIPDGKGHFENKIGIVDITDPRVPYGPEFVSLNASQDTFTLKDGGRKYSLTIDKDGAVVIKRPGGEGDAVINTSISQLETMRLDQIASRGSVDIAGKQYYVLGQGGIKGALVFFDRKQVDDRAPGTEAVASTEVSEIAAGKTRPVQGKPDLGKIDGKPYHLEFDNDLKMWKVAPGAGDPPPAPPKDPAAGGPAGKEPAAGGGTAGEVKTLADVIALLKKNGFVEPDPDGNQGFSDDMKTKVHILQNPKGVLPWCFVLAPGIRPDNQWCPGEAAGESLQGIRGFADYGVVEYTNTKQYLSLDFFAGKAGVESSGIYGKTGMSGVTDVGIAMDMLASYEEFSDADLITIEERLRKHASGVFFISNNKAQKTVLIRSVDDKKTYRVWPDEGEGAAGDNAGLEDRKGPGTAVDLSFGPDADFQKELPYDATQKMILAKASADGGTALYLLEDAGAGEKRWFIMVRAAVDGSASRSKHVQVFGTGKDWNAMPASFELKGYAGTEVPRTAKLGLVRSSDGKKGSLALYRTTIPSKDGSNVKDKKGNCVGPVVWWGVDARTALKASQNGSF